MRTLIPRHPAVRVAWLSLLGCLALTAAVQAEPLKEFTGYTCPGRPVGDRVFFKGGNMPVDFEPSVLGGTVYFAVYDQANGGEGDPWGTGIKGIGNMFMSGRGLNLANSGGLDTSARYLYLYQTINDRPNNGGKVTATTIKLLVDPYTITSWGYFVEKDKANAMGVGFHSENARGKDNKIGFAAHSFGLPAVTDGNYRDLAPAVQAKAPYALDLIKKEQAIAPVSDAGETAAVVPNTVFLLNTAYFGDLNDQQRANFMGAPNDLYHWPLGAVPRLGSIYSTLLPMTDRERQAAAFYDGRRAPAIRAIWETDPINPKGRSVVFGFTSNEPPVYEYVRVNWTKVPGEKDVVPAADANIAAAAGPGATGTVPTPVPPAEPAPGVSTAPGASTGGLTPGLTGGGGGLSGGGGGFSGPGIGGGTGAGIGGGRGGGGGGRQQGQGNDQVQNPRQGQSGNQNQVPIIVVRVNQNNLQIQKQKQQQQQQQNQNNCCDPPTDVIPEPASALLAVLGLPFLFLVTRWRAFFVKPATAA